MQSRFNTHGSLHCTSAQPFDHVQCNLNESIVKWVVDTVSSFSAVEQKSFHALIHSVNPSLIIPSRHTVRHLILQKHITLRERVRSYIATSAKSVCLTCDAWSSRVYRGYMTITVHFIDNSWKMKSCLLDFVRFKTPHTGEASFGILHDTIKTWELDKMVHSITTDNAADIVRGVEILRSVLYAETYLDQYRPRRSFHVRCIAHVLNLAVKECMQLVHDKLEKVRRLLSSIRCSVKRRALFNDIKVEMGVRCELPGLDVETRWSSTFDMIRKCFAARRVLTAMVSREEELEDLLVSESEWKLADKVCTFLSAAASATEHQSGSNYVTVSVTSRIFEKLESSCKDYMEEEEGLLHSVAKAMLLKLEKYRSLVNTEAARFVRILDPRFRTNILSDADVLRCYVDLPQEETPDGIVHCETRMKTFMDDILEENSADLAGDDEITRFLRATSNADKGASPLVWWKGNSQRFPHIAKAAQRFMAMQASSVASEATFSVSGNLVNAERSSLSDESITACMCVRSWERFLESVSK